MLLIGACVLTAVASVDAASTPQPQAYRWRNVRMDGMGFVTGIVVQPGRPGLVYIRTDVGGCYRWDDRAAAWTPLMDSYGPSDWPGGLESIAVDPTDPNTVYAAGSFGGTPDIRVSHDCGATWRPLGLRRSDGKAIAMECNGPYRGAGERLAVNPVRGADIFFGSRCDGLFHSTDGGATWTAASSLPGAGTPQFGVTFVQFAPDGRTAFAGIAGSGVFVSRDDGVTWKLADSGVGAQAFPCRAAVDNAGRLFVTYASVDGKSGALHRIDPDGAVKDISPGGANRAFVGIASDMGRAGWIATYAGAFGVDTLYVSTNAGDTWRQTKFDFHVPSWWPAYVLRGGAFGYSSALVLDQAHPGAAWAAGAFGVFYTADIFADRPVWSARMTNLEEMVVLALSSPTAGPPLVSGCADMHGFRHDKLDEVPRETLTGGVFGDTDSLDFCATRPNVIVRVGGGENDGKASSGYSTDGGQTWRPFANYPANFNNGKVAISATDPKLIVWAPMSNHRAASDPLSTVYPVRSVDGGQTWQTVEGAQRNQGVLGMWFGGTPLAADRVDGDLFYYYEQGRKENGLSTGGRMRRSIDGGAHWQVTAGLPDWYEVSVKAVPGRRGDVWVGYSNGQALYRSTDAGVTFAPVPGLGRIRQYGFGAGKPGAGCPAVYVLGVVQGQEGLFRSDDFLSLPPGDAANAHWRRIDSGEGFGGATCMTGDGQVYGRVYVGTGGRGILFGSLPF